MIPQFHPTAVTQTVVIRHYDRVKRQDVATSYPLLGFWHFPASTPETHPLVHIEGKLRTVEDACVLVAHAAQARDSLHREVSVSFEIFHGKAS